MIDIEEVEEDGKELKYILENEKILSFKNYVDSTLLALEQQQAEIEQLKKDNEWISVDNYIYSNQEFYCLDEYGQQLIGYLEKDPDRFDFELQKDCFICEKNGVILDNIKYFKPLPKPPEE